MDYDKTIWRNGESPPINADNLNKIENAIEYLHSMKNNIGDLIKNFVPDTRTVNNKRLNQNISIIASDIGLGNVTNESKETMFTNPSFTGTAVTAASTEYTTRMLRTTVLSTAAPSGGQNGDIWHRYSV
ncbi:MAG: hypothetical protein LBC82_01235 [Oscillospiraceae bacterium]|jgi:hypothetical protein|nr:hypothetical protein [Oscillospiraceae bacterium]